MANHLKENVASYVKSGHTVTFDIGRLAKDGRRIPPRWGVTDEQDVAGQRWRWECSCGAHGRWVEPQPGAWSRVRLFSLWLKHTRVAHAEFLASLQHAR